MGDWNDRRKEEKWMPGIYGERKEWRCQADLFVMTVTWSVFVSLREVVGLDKRRKYNDMYKLYFK